MGSKRGKRTATRPVQQVAGSHRILRLDTLLQVTGLSRSAVYKGMATNTFPKSVPISARAVGWIESEVMDWIEAQVSARDAATA